MALKRQFKLKARLWRWNGAAAWHFLTLPKSQSAYIKQHFGVLTNGWGSVPVSVTLGKSTWNTSIFPDKKAGAYLLPIKAAIRKREDLAENTLVPFLLQIR